MAGTLPGRPNIGRFDQSRELMMHWFVANNPDLAAGLRLLPSGKPVQVHDVIEYVIELLYSGVGAARYVAICAFYRLDALDGLEVLRQSGTWTAEENARMEQASDEVKGLLGDAYVMSGGDLSASHKVLHTLWLAFFGDRAEIQSAETESKQQLAAITNEMQAGLKHMHPLARKELSDFAELCRE